MIISKIKFIYLRFISFPFMINTHTVILSSGSFSNLGLSLKSQRYSMFLLKFHCFTFIFIPIVLFKIDFYVMVWGRDQDSVFPTYITSVKYKWNPNVSILLLRLFYASLVCVCLFKGWKCHTACRILVYKPGLNPWPPSPESHSWDCQGSPCSSPLESLSSCP